MAEPTKGPWGVYFDEEANQFQVFSDEGRGFGHTIATIVGVRGAFKANAHLIAAAPDLLKELETAIAWIEDSGNLYAPTQDEVLPQLRAAIAKARGA